MPQFITDVYALRIGLISRMHWALYNAINAVSDKGKQRDISFTSQTHKSFLTLYRVFQEETSKIWEVIVSVILSKKLYICMCPIPNGFRDRAISLFSTLYTVQTSNTPCPHTSRKVHWCWRWNFRKCIILGKLYQLCHLNNKYRY
jgi:hypothetical protein